MFLKLEEGGRGAMEWPHLGLPRGVAGRAAHRGAEIQFDVAPACRPAS